MSAVVIADWVFDLHRKIIAEQNERKNNAKANIAIVFASGKYRWVHLTPTNLKRQYHLVQNTDDDLFSLAIFFQDVAGKPAFDLFGKPISPQYNLVTAPIVLQVKESFGMMSGSTEALQVKGNNE